MVRVHRVVVGYPANGGTVKDVRAVLVYRRNVDCTEVFDVHLEPGVPLPVARSLGYDEVRFDPQGPEEGLPSTFSPSRAVFHQEGLETPYRRNSVWSWLWERLLPFREPGQGFLQA